MSSRANFGTSINVSWGLSTDLPVPGDHDGDGKNGAMTVPGGTLRTKAKWDGSTLRQEFSSAQRQLVKSWTIDANDRLVLTEKFVSHTLNSESKAVFDRQ